MSDAQRWTGVPEFQQRHRMKLALEVAKLSVEGMAAHLELSRNTVGNYLNGRTRPTVAVLRVWALRCGVPYEWLRDGDPGDPEPKGPAGLTIWYAPTDSRARTLRSIGHGQQIAA